MGKTVIHRRATSPEARENQVISAAVDLAEKQILNGTATSQVIVHFLKLASTKERLEKERLRKEIDLMEAKINAMGALQRDSEMYEAAINAMKNYGGHGSDEDESS